MHIVLTTTNYIYSSVLRQPPCPCPDRAKRDDDHTTDKAFLRLVWDWDDHRPSADPGRDKPCPYSIGIAQSEPCPIRGAVLSQTTLSPRGRTDKPPGMELQDPPSTTDRPTVMPV